MATTNETCACGCGQPTYPNSRYALACYQRVIDQQTAERDRHWSAGRKAGPKEEYESEEAYRREVLRLMDEESAKER